MVPGSVQGGCQPSAVTAEDAGPGLVPGPRARLGAAPPSTGRPARTPDGAGPWPAQAEAPTASFCGRPGRARPRGAAGKEGKWDLSLLCPSLRPVVGGSELPRGLLPSPQTRAASESSGTEGACGQSGGLLPRAHPSRRRGPAGSRRPQRGPQLQAGSRLRPTRPGQVRGASPVGKAQRDAPPPRALSLPTPLTRGGSTPRARSPMQGRRRNGLARPPSPRSSPGRPPPGTRSPASLSHRPGGFAEEKTGRHLGLGLKTTFLVGDIRGLTPLVVSPRGQKPGPLPPVCLFQHLSGQQRWPSPRRQHPRDLP